MCSVLVTIIIQRFYVYFKKICHNFKRFFMVFLILNTTGYRITSKQATQKPNGRDSPLGCQPGGRRLQFCEFGRKLEKLSMPVCTQCCAATLLRCLPSLFHSFYLIFIFVRTHPISGSFFNTIVSRVFPSVSNTMISFSPFFSSGAGI